MIGRQQDGIDRYDEAVVAVALSRFQLQGAIARERSPGSRLRAQPWREGRWAATRLLIPNGARSRIGNRRMSPRGDLPNGLPHHGDGPFAAQAAVA